LTDTIAIVRALGALLTVLGLLAGALWAVRRYQIVLPGTHARRPERRLAVVERLSLDPRRSLALLRRDGVEHLVLIAPEGHLVIESRIDPVTVAEKELLPEPPAVSEQQRTATSGSPGPSARLSWQEALNRGIRQDTAVTRSDHHA
jgi:flagellar protein FliO/FliZ